MIDFLASFPSWALNTLFPVGLRVAIGFAVLGAGLLAFAVVDKYRARQELKAFQRSLKPKHQEHG